MYANRPNQFLPNPIDQQLQLKQKKKKEPLKEGSLPPIPTGRQYKPTCASPPQVLKDKKSTFQFQKGKLLGEGGFAKCYEVFDANGKKFAAKVVPKQTLKNQKAKQKLFTEIKIHQHLKHKYIVKFQHVFEDQENVYMILELCENKTFVEMMKKRRRLTEAEVRFYLNQLMEAIAYMHQKKVIHRDLKLGNLFLASDMDLKVGDFGLATVLSEDGDRKRTICGTPNYIAPEILFDRDHGHSFEVDLWSTGVIMYTLIIGRPPFQTKDVKAIYRNIKENKYDFPSNVQISDMAKDLIGSLLTTRPDLRPTIQEVMGHPWFQLTIPKSIPISALNEVPILESPLKKIEENQMTKVGQFTKPWLEMKAPPKKSDSKQRVALGELQLPNSNIPSTPRDIKKPTDWKPTVVEFTPLVKKEGQKMSMLETMFMNIEKALQALKEGKTLDLCLPQEQIQAPKIFISKWIDYSNKYGLGYQLTNGSFGVYFNDSTSLIMACNEKNVEYLEYAQGSEKTVMNRHAYQSHQYPETLKKKMTLLNHFKSYMQENLYKASQYNYQDYEKCHNLDFLVKYMRTKHAVLFRLTNRMVQINFFDHSKLLLSKEGLVVTFINRERQMETFGLDAALNRDRGDVLSRLKYARDILESLTKTKRTATTTE